MKIESLRRKKYKDEKPLNTINRIRNILRDMGIVTVEENWQNSAEGFCSVTVKIVGTNLQTNGKGTTHEYALASGYAELMERLQNQAQFRLSVDVSPEALEYKGFYYAPDEKFLNIHDIMNSKEDWITIQLKKIDTDANRYNLLKQWRQMTKEDAPIDFIALPYLNIFNNQVSHIPVKMASKMYMSNGMCAGNTIEEALVQGISEIFERAVNKEIINNKVSPPTIPMEYLMDYPSIVSMIKALESCGNYTVIVKDCSLGKDYPVVGVIFINKDEQTYFIKFGAHPKLEIAIERTLTELLQGQNIKKLMGVKEFSYKHEVNHYENLMGILVNGSGYYPNELFSSEHSYEFKGFKDIGELDNKEMLEYLLSLIKAEDLDVFVRDVSFLNFPSYHVVIPGLSEIEEIDDVESLNSYIEYSKVKKYIRNLDEASTKDEEKIIKHMEKFNGRGSITQFLNIPIKGVFPWYYTSLHLFTGALHYKKGDYSKAYESFDNYVKSARASLYGNVQYNKMMVNYYKCARDYIGAHIDNLEKSKIIDMLSRFYPMNIIRGVMTDFGDQERVLKGYGELKCWNCQDCRLKPHCQYANVEDVYKTLKDRYSQAKIDQKSLCKQLQH